MLKSISGPAWLAFAALCLIWGASYEAANIAVSGVGAFPDFLCGAIRYLGGGVIILIIRTALRQKGLPQPANIIGLCAAGLLLGIANAAMNTALHIISEGMAAVIASSAFVFASGFSVCLGVSSLTKSLGSGVATSFAGIVLVFRGDLHYSSRGIELMLVNAVAVAVANILLDRYIDKQKRLTSTLIYLAATGGSMLAVSICLHESLPSPLRWQQQTWAMLYLTVMSSAVAFVIYFWLLGNAPFVFVTSMAVIHPLVALLIDRWYEKSAAISVEMRLGMGIVLFGLACTIFSQSHSRHKKPVPA